MEMALKMAAKIGVRMAWYEDAIIHSESPPAPTLLGSCAALHPTVTSRHVASRRAE